MALNENGLGMSNPLHNLKIDYWYKAALVVGAVVLITALTVELKGVENSIVQLIALGTILVGIGEWINHPLQTQIVPPSPRNPTWLKGEGYLRKNSALGLLFVISGVGFIGLGIWKLVV